MSDISGGTRRSAWSRAASLAERTPASRNRYVDFLRAVSIGFVVLGHWVIAAPWMSEGSLRLEHMLAVQPWTQWLTWLFQVMPVFFMVGGYSNAASWEAARRNGLPYGSWIAGRLHRLVGPMLPLLLVWSVMAAVGRALGVPAEMIRVGSQVSLVPLWFLAVYIMVVLLVPVTRSAWRRFGVGSFWALVAVAVVVDVARFAGGYGGFAWTNYLFIWLAVHQLGYFWRDGKLGGPDRSAPWALAGAIVILGLVTLGPYPRSMVSVPGEAVSNTLPPSLAMLCIGLIQCGLLLSLEPTMRRWLSRARPWTATVLVNGTIMTVYLWHVTAMAWVIGIARLLGGRGMRLEPGTGVWWATRPLWLAVLAAVLLVAVALFGRFERIGGPRPGARLPWWRTLLGAFHVCGGLGAIAYRGIGSEGWLGINLSAVLAVFAGAALLGVIRLPWRRKEAAGGA